MYGYIFSKMCTQGTCTASLPPCCPSLSAACGALRLGANARAVLRRAMWLQGTYRELWIWSRHEEAYNAAPISEGDLPRTGFAAWRHLVRALLAQGDVFQANLAGVVDAGDGKREPAVLYLYLKGMRHEDSTTFRCCSASSTI
jgi:hypothetical protein